MAFVISSALYLGRPRHHYAGCVVTDRYGVVGREMLLGNRHRNPDSLHLLVVVEGNVLGNETSRLDGPRSADPSGGRLNGQLIHPSRGILRQTSVDDLSWRAVYRRSPRRLQSELPKERWVHEWKSKRTELSERRLVNALRRKAAHRFDSTSSDHCPCTGAEIGHPLEVTHRLDEVDLRGSFPRAEEEPLDDGLGPSRWPRGSGFTGYGHIKAIDLGRVVLGLAEKGHRGRAGGGFSRRENRRDQDCKAQHTDWCFPVIQHVRQYPASSVQCQALEMMEYSVHNVTQCIRRSRRRATEIRHDA